MREFRGIKGFIVFFLVVLIFLVVLFFVLNVIIILIPVVIVVAILSWLVSLFYRSKRPKKPVVQVYVKKF